MYHYPHFSVDTDAILDLLQPWPCWHILLRKTHKQHIYQWDAIAERWIIVQAISVLKGIVYEIIYE